MRSVPIDIGIKNPTSNEAMVFIAAKVDAMAELISRFIDTMTYTRSLGLNDPHLDALYAKVDEAGTNFLTTELALIRWLMKEMNAVDFEDFKKKLDADKAGRFAAFQKTFNDEMAKRGDPRTLETILGANPNAKKIDAPFMPAWDAERSEQLGDLFEIIAKETADEDPRDIVLRAMSIYRSFVTHARGGGQVKFVKEGAEPKTLKVRLR